MSISNTSTTAQAFRWSSRTEVAQTSVTEPQQDAFGARYRVVAYSRRFHGAGRWPAQGDDSAEAHTSDLLAIMRLLDAGPIHLVGFSTAIALRATLRGSSLVRSLTIVEPNLPWLLEGDPEGEATLA